MNKVIISSLVSLLAGSVFAAPYATAVKPITVYGGEINFQGSIVAAPCAVDNESANQTVALGQVPANKLTSKGDSSAAVAFSIKLAGCELAGAENLAPEETANYTKAAITFNGSSIDGSVLELRGSGAGDEVAQNVGIQILQNGKPIKVDGATPTAATDLMNGKNEILFAANYVATADDVTAGTANSTASFTISYE